MFNVSLILLTVSCMIILSIESLPQNNEGLTVSTGYTVLNDDSCKFTSKLERSYVICTEEIIDNLMNQWTISEKEKLSRKCISEVGIKKNFDTFYCNKAKYKSNPATSFTMLMGMMHMRRIVDSRSVPDQAEQLSCCILSSLGFINQNRTIDIGKLKSLLKQAINNENVRKAIDLADEQCEVPASCMPVHLLECYVDVCAEHLSTLN